MTDVWLTNLAAHAVQMAPSVILLTLLGTIIAAALLFVAKRYPSDQDEVVEKINACLPQTQCAQCGHPGCRPYAVAIAAGEAINRCPPGGEAAIKQLAQLLGQETVALDSNFGEEQIPKIAKIREQECIGCTLCIQACPVDAIIGATQLMHVVLQDICTGCDLCLEPCPVDCIDMVDGPSAEQQSVSSANKIDPAFLNAAPITSPHQACIRCGFCEEKCPKNLAPQELFWQRNNSDALALLDLDSCIECRICDRICPSDIPLTDYFVNAKQRIDQEVNQRERAKITEVRFEDRTKRLEVDQTRVKTRPSRKDKSQLLATLKSKQ